MFHDVITRQHKEIGMTAGAVFSSCEVYRYLLWREWDATKPTLTFCMLNPSTATHLVLDNTIQGCMTRALAWGYGRLEIVNLFALRSTDPKGLGRIADPIGPYNDAYILRHAKAAGLLICGWGGDKAVGQRGPQLLARLRAEGIVPHALFVNANGSPKHPLYVAHSLTPVRME